MAFLADDDKMIQEGQDANQQQPQVGGESSAPLVNQGGGIAGSSVSTAGVGKGGRGNFTNIQAYLEANKDNNTTGNALASQVGSALDAEKSKIETDSAAKQSEGQSKVQEAQNLRQKAGQYLTSDQILTDDESTIKNAVAGEYKAPQVAYTLGNEASQYGQQLQSDQGFDSLLNQTYNKAAGGQISTGQKSLQRQLDLNNTQLAGQRQDLTARYRALEPLATAKTQETNAATTGYQTAYDTDKTAAKNDLETARRQTEAAMTGYQGKEQGYGMLRNKYEAISRMLGVEPIRYEYPGESKGGDYQPEEQPVIKRML